jgi:hypothetical protein
LISTSHAEKGLIDNGEIRLNVVLLRSLLSGEDTSMREEADWWIEDAKRCLMKAEKYFELGFCEDSVFNCQQA